MKKLSETWFAEGYIDFELKKYTLLAYLQEVGKFFNENKLYPQLAAVVFHYNNLVAFRENKKFLQEHFPKKLTGIQMEKSQLLYEQMIEDTELMHEQQVTIHYATDTLKGTLQPGASIYEFVEDTLQIIPIGLVPLDTMEGYFFLRSGHNRQMQVYHYRLSIFEKHDEKYRSIKTAFLDERRFCISHTYEILKSELIRKRSNLPNPDVYAVETNLQFPNHKKLLPEANQRHVR